VVKKNLKPQKPLVYYDMVTQVLSFLAVYRNSSLNFIPSSSDFQKYAWPPCSSLPIVGKSQGHGVLSMQAAQLCCSVKAVSGSRAKRPTYYPLPFPQLLSIGHETGWGWLRSAKDYLCQVWSTWDQWLHSGVAAWRWNIRVLWLFFFFFFLDTPADQTESARWTQNGSKYAGSRRVGPFVG